MAQCLLHSFAMHLQDYDAAAVAVKKEWKIAGTETAAAQSSVGIVDPSA